MILLIITIAIFIVGLILTILGKTLKISKISPPDVIYNAHYLCTVSLKGYKKIVKSIRICKIYL